LIARFEHRVEVVADVGYEGRIAVAEWGSIIPPMLPLLREGRADDALIAGLDALDALLASRGFVGDGRAPNELPDETMHEDAGDR